MRRNKQSVERSQQRRIPVPSIGGANPRVQQRAMAATNRVENVVTELPYLTAKIYRSSPLQIPSDAPVLTEPQNGMVSRIYQPITNEAVTTTSVIVRTFGDKIGNWFKVGKFA